jgi:hypothetical protein
MLLAIGTYAAYIVGTSVQTYDAAVFARLNSAVSEALK